MIALIATALALELLYVYVISSGKFGHWQFNLGYLNDLAEGFRQWHLRLAADPPAALLARPNPFDPANRDLWLWDVSLYHGHYYLYWGPLPAFLLAVVKTIFRISSVVGDENVVFWLTTLQLVAGTLFVERAARRLYDQQPPLVLQVLAVLVLGVSNPTIYNLSRPAVYESAIVGGHAFLLLGLVFACEAIASQGPRRAALGAAGASWACALACRISLAPAVALLVVTTAFGAAAGRAPRARQVIVALFWVGLPVALGFFGLLLYNRLRFDSWLEFGRTYQLSTIEPLVDKRFIRPNLYAYLRRPPVWSCRFPFAFSQTDIGARAFPPGFQLPPGYFVYEQVVGVLAGMPWCWLALIALVTAARSTWRARATSPRASVVAVTAVAASIGILPAMMLPSATNRYLGDISGALALLAALGVWTAYEEARARPRLRKLVLAAALALAVPTLIAGFGLGIVGQYGNFEANNFPLYFKLVRDLSVCRGPIPVEPK